MAYTRFQCSQGNSCEFFAEWEKFQQNLGEELLQVREVAEKEMEANTSTAAKFAFSALNYSFRSSCGAAASYVSGGSSLVGAVFNPLTHAASIGVNRLVFGKIDGRNLNDRVNQVVAHGMLAVGVGIASSVAFECFGYPVTNAVLAVNIIPSIVLSIAAVTAKVIYKRNDELQKDNAHKGFHHRWQQAAAEENLVSEIKQSESK